MEALLALREKLVSLRDDYIAILKMTFEDLAIEIEQLNIDQLQQGLRSDGSPLPNYSPVSVYVYGKPAGRIKLFDTGNFYAGITLVVTNDGIEIISRDIKTQMLQIRYGDDIIGLSEDSIEKLKDKYTIELLIKYVRQHLLK